MINPYARFVRDNDMEHYTELSSQETANYVIQQSITILSVGTIILFVLIAIASYHAGKQKGEAE